MTFFSKLCILAIVAYVQASPKLSRAEGEAGSAWSKFLGKVPEYFTGAESHELEASDGAAASSGEALNDEIANDGGTNYPNPSQISQTQWQDQFKQCMNSNYGQSSSSGSSSSSESSNQYGANQISGFTGSSDAYKESFEKCRSQVSNSLGQYPGANNGQDFLSQYKPQIPSNIGPSNFGSYTSALTGSSPSSGSSASA